MTPLGPNAVAQASLCLHVPGTESVCNEEKLTLQAQEQKHKAAVVPEEVLEGLWNEAESSG